MDRLKELLSLIQSGESSFSPEDESDEALQAFQSTAKFLMYAKNEGLIDVLIPHQKTKTEHHLYDLFMIRGGLTYKGEQFLNGDDSVISSNPIVIQRLVMRDNFSNISSSTIVNHSQIEGFLNNNNITSQDKKALVEAITEIQKLVKQLQENNPIATETEIIAYIDDETTPSFKHRAVCALKAAGESAFDELLLENKYLKILKAAIKGWIK